MAKMLVQTTLPHRAQPGKQYTRTDGDVTLSITDLGGAGLPYGAYPRLILIWMTTEALRTREPKVGAWTFPVEVHGAARLAMHGRSLGNDSAV